MSAPSAVQEVRTPRKPPGGRRRSPEDRRRREPRCAAVSRPPRSRSRDRRDRRIPHGCRGFAQPGEGPGAPGPVSAGQASRPAGGKDGVDVRARDCERASRGLQDRARRSNDARGGPHPEVARMTSAGGVV